MNKLKSSIVIIGLVSIGFNAFANLPPKRIPKTFKTIPAMLNQTLLNMVHIPAGNYTMGPSNPNWQSGNTYPPHLVKLRGFYFYKYNVSYHEYDSYTRFSDKPLVQNKYLEPWDFFRSENHPVDSVTWYQASSYCQWLGKKTGLPFSLPTEAQWEYVARNGGKKNWPFATNNGKQELGKNFPSGKMFEDQKGNDTKGFFPLPVGSLPCTPMGICGLNGEVNQWVKDWYGKRYYAHSPVDNPQGPGSGKLKAVRGGGSDNDPSYSNVFDRFGSNPSTGTAGFRCVINSNLSMQALKAKAEQHLK